MKDLRVNDDVKRTKERSPVFPFIPLSAAIERAKQFFAEEKRGSTLLAIAGRHWGYSPSSSGLLQTVGALKNYGLLSDEGSGQDRRIRLTDMALRIILDERPDSIERAEYLRMAALKPAVSADVHKKWPDGLPSNATLNHYLVLEKKFNQETALKVAKIINKNQSLIENLSIDNLSSDGMIESDLDVVEDATVRQLKSDTNSQSWSAPAPRHSANGIVRGEDRRNEKEIGSIRVTKGCQLSIIADGEVTQEGLEKLISYIELIKTSFPEKEQPVAVVPQ